MHNAILINPKTGETKMLRIEDGLKEKQILIGARVITGVGYITKEGKVGGFDDDFIYASDETTDDDDFVGIKDYGEELYTGNILIVGSDGEGGNADVKLTVDEVKSFTMCIKRNELNSMFR